MSDEHMSDEQTGGGGRCLAGRGAFITLEGGHGAGKTSLARDLVARLEQRGQRVLAVREPGSTPLGQTIRDMLLAHDRDDMEPLAELLLFMAARVQLVKRRIEPALAAGTWVVCDRFIDSSVVFQGRAMGIARVQEIIRVCLGSLKPDLTLILDIDPVRAQARLDHTAMDSSFYQSKAQTFHQHIRDGFAAVAAAEPDRCVMIDADQPLAKVRDRLWTAVQAKLQAKLQAKPQPKLLAKENAHVRK
ncbi:MAG: dTMP kinase [Pseudomonadota bacterium]